MGGQYCPKFRQRITATSRSPLMPSMSINLLEYKSEPNPNRGHVADRFFVGLPRDGFSRLIGGRKRDANGWNGRQAARRAHQAAGSTGLPFASRLRPASRREPYRPETVKYFRACGLTWT